MRVRITIVAALTAVWLVVWAVMLTDDPSKEQRRELVEQLSGSDLGAEREELYVWTANAERLWRRFEIEQQPFDPTKMFNGGVQQPQLGSGARSNPDRIRLLVIGDSFTHGGSLHDPDRRWPSLLQQRLDETVGDEVFEVVALAFPGASTYSQGRWAELITAGTAEAIPVAGEHAALLHQGFDTVLLGWYSNDTLPHPGDETFAHWDEQVEAEHGEQAVLETFTPVENPGTARVNPNAVYVTPAARSIRALARTGTALVMRLTSDERSIGGEKDSLQPFVTAGFEVAATEKQDALLRSRDDTELIVSPFDNHPGPALQASYASDAVTAVLKTVDPSRLRAAVAGAAKMSGGHQSRLISSFLPTNLEIDETPNSVTVRLTGDAELSELCPRGGVNGHTFICDNRGVRYRLARSGEAAAQHVPCLSLDRPHARIMLDPRLNRGRWRVAHRLDGGARLQLYVIGYDADGEPMLTAAGELAAGESTVVELGGEQARGLMVAQSGNEGCSDKDQPVRLDPIELSLTAQP